MTFLYTAALLNAEQVHTAIQALDSLHNEWTRRAPEPLPIFTLGAATYLDARAGNAPYAKLSLQKNVILNKHFTWLYELFIHQITLTLGPATLEHELALPGFHIFGNHPTQPLSPALCRLLENTPASIHIDTPYKNHLLHWTRYEQVDFLNPLSMTVCLEVPVNGAGLNTWHAVEGLTNLMGHPVIEGKFNMQALGTPTYHAYKQGWIYVSTGHHVHQIASSHPFLVNDRRITLQAHAIQCDGLWRVFF